MRLAEPLLEDPANPAELAAAVRICAAVWTRRGLVDRAAQLYSWLGAERIGPDWAIGATVLYLAGRVGDARAFSASASLWPPTEATAHAALIAASLAQSLRSATPVLPGVTTDHSAPKSAPATGNGSASPRAAAVAAATALIQAGRAGGAPDVDRFLPGIGTAIATLLCLSMGEPRRAADALQTVTAAASNGVAFHDFPRVNGDGPPAWSRTLPAPGVPETPRSAGPRTVLAAWSALCGGDEQSATTLIAPLDIDALAPRDRLLGHGLRVGAGAPWRRPGSSRRGLARGAPAVR